MKVRRVGHLYPSGGINDPELQRMAPKGLDILTTRMPFRDTSRDSDAAFAQDLETHVALVADACVDLVAFNCTAASLIIGPDALRERIATATGLPSVTTIEAVMNALRAVGARKLALLTPYPAGVVDTELAYFTSRGLQVVAQTHLPCATPVEQGEISAERWIAALDGLDLSGADAVLFSCAGIRIADTIGALEARAGRPVITSNSALIWQICATLGTAAPDARFGRLMAQPCAA